MAADDDRDPAPDPWDEIVAEGLGGDAGEMTFRFEDEPAVSPPAADVDATAPGDPAPEEGEPAASAAEAEDALVEDWLTNTDGDGDGESAPPLSVFSPEDAAAESSAIDIATGSSGIALHGTAAQEEIGSDAFAAPPSDGETAADAWAGVGADGESDPEAGGFPDVTAGAVAGAVTAGKAVARPARPAKKAGGIGQMIGVVLGGAMAIPITLAILIYGLGKDPFGATKMVPPEAAFLLPAKFRPGFKKAPGAAARGSAPSPLDDLPVADEPVVPDPPVNDVAVAEPADEPAPVTAEPADPAGDVPEIAPVVDPVMPADPVPSTDVVAVAPPDLDAPGGFGVAPAPAAPEPPPLDTGALDEAVDEAAALGQALGAVADRDNRAYTLLRTRWYRALARVAEELVAVEHAAATSGRPLAGAPDNVATLHGGLGGREALAAELAALAPDWLAYANRGSDGVVLPVTFESARKVGPYWSARVTLAGGDGEPRPLTVISRGEPAAVAGDRIVVTGVALEGAVIWAADVRGAGGGGEPPAEF